MNEELIQVLTNKAFVSIFFTWVIAGIIKYVTDKNKKKRLAQEFFTTGGMPSAHAAVTTALTLSVYFMEGFSTLFIACAVFTIIIIRDSFGVRWSVGEQAILINKIIKHEHMHEHAKIVLGHTRLQVIAGIALGALTTIIIHFLT